MTHPPPALVQTALQRAEAMVGADPSAPSGQTTWLMALLGSAVESYSEIPNDILRDPQLRETARQLERLLFNAFIAELTQGESRRDGVREISDALRGFQMLRDQLEGEPGLSYSGDTVKLGSEVLELAHDIRSPLTSVLFLADTLRHGQSGPVNELQQRQLGIIYSAAIGLVSLANDVIGLAHQAEQLLDRNPSYFSMRELLDSVVDLVQPIADQRTLSLRVMVHGHDQRMGHPTVVSRIFLNLTTNALKYTESGMVELTARSLGGDQMELSVRDTGPGLDAETIAHMYEPFRRKSERRGPSLDTYGLGLTICQKLVRALGSELRFETAPEWGTRFFFEVALPVVPIPR